ncbi:urease accessory protein UreH [SAR202 cluster bacterium AC-409-J13_OGT_754m]|nr:urease accessory protein UreH [SAR202 cluster bacterium AC-409-J13_OGT_754m]
MEPEYGVVYALTLGFLLGLKHATDADHVVAVSTIVGDSKSIWRGLWIGGSWGLGHTTPLLILGIIILMFKETVLDKYESIAPFLELGVGFMLIFLGLQVMWKISSGRLYLHQHVHNDGDHIHIHSTHQQHNQSPSHKGVNLVNHTRPYFRLKSFIIGIIHGLAGSAAVMLILLPTIGSFWLGLAYILLFGIGTIISMSAITLILGLPFAIGKGFKNINVTVSGIAGFASITLGALITYDFAFNTTLVPF